MKEQEVSVLFWWGQLWLFPIHFTPAIGWVLTEEKPTGSGSNLASGRPHGSRHSPPAEKGLNTFSPCTNVEFLNSILPASIYGGGGLVDGRAKNRFVLARAPKLGDLQTQGASSPTLV